MPEDNAWIEELLRHPIPNKIRVEVLDDVEKAPQKPYQIFWGGADLDPSLYNRERSQRCGRSHLAADIELMDKMRDCINNEIPIIGICRSAQVLNVVNGGILVQHINEHTHSHDVTITDMQGNVELICPVSSTHHQMMIPHKDGIILAKDHRPVTGVHWDDVNEEHEYERTIEVVYYPKTKSLCIQPHPEWMDQHSPFVHWINRFIKEHMGLGPINFADEEYNFIRNGE